MSNPPLKAAIIPVTPLQQNCTLLWCTETMKGAFVDPGGDLERLKAAAAQAGVTIEKILVTHGHIDHCGQAGILAEQLGVPIEGPHEEDLFWISRLQEDGQRYGINGKPFESDRYLADGDKVTVGKLTFDVRHCPGHTPGHMGLRIASGGESLLIWGDVIHAPAYQFSQPDWSVAFDADMESARASRHRMLDMAATDRLAVAGMHLDFPAMGYVERQGDAYRYVAAPLDYRAQ